MAQVHKGSRRQIAARMPSSLVEHIELFAGGRGMSLSEAVADLVATALGEPLPSETLPQPKARKQREELPLAMTA